MAQDYEAGLSLQDKFTQTLEKALKATEKFKEQITKTQKEVDELAKKKVDIPVKATIASSGFSSFSAVNTEIDRLNRRTISINAAMNPNVTAQLEQRITHMGESLSTALNTAIISAFNRANGGLTEISTVGNSVISNTTALTGAIGALTAAIASMNRNVTVRTPISNPTPIPQNPSELERPSWFQRHFPNDNLYDNHNVSYFGGNKTIHDPRYASLIERQQQTYQNSFGGSYLSNLSVNHDWYQTAPEMEEDIGPRSVTRRATAFESAMNRMKQSAASTARAVGGYFSIAWGGVKYVFDLPERAFNKLREKVESKPLGLRLEFAGERALYNVLGTFNRMHNAIGKNVNKFRELSNASSHPITARFIDLASRGISKIRSGLRSLTDKAWSVTVKVAGKAAEELKEMLKTAGMLGLMGATAGAGAAIKGGSDLEQNEISMKHFIGLNDKDKNSVNKKTEAYLNDLNKYANKTPFGNNEVMNAGRRALTVSGGDITQAKKLVELSGDMAA